MCSGGYRGLVLTCFRHPWHVEPELTHPCRVEPELRLKQVGAGLPLVAMCSLQHLHGLHALGCGCSVLHLPENCFDLGSNAAPATVHF